MDERARYRMTFPQSAMSVCRPYDGKHRAKPGRCEPLYGVTSMVPVPENLLAYWALYEEALRSRVDWGGLEQMILRGSGRRA